MVLETSHLLYFCGIACITTKPETYFQGHLRPALENLWSGGSILGLQNSE